MAKFFHFTRSPGGFYKDQGTLQDVDTRTPEHVVTAVKLVNSIADPRVKEFCEDYFSSGGFCQLFDGQVNSHTFNSYDELKRAIESRAMPAAPAELPDVLK